MLSLGQRLRDRYRIDALPDSESGLHAYRGYDTVDNRLCAIKEYEGEQAARLEREAEALTLHRHPNLPVAFEAFLLDGHLFVVFEWPEGESLQARVKREGRMAEAEATRFITQVLSALDYVYTLNLPIARGGFAPAHIWIAPDGRPRLYVGVVAVTNAAPYIAPEGGADPRAAIYSAGAVLYNLLTGRSPEGSASPRKFHPRLSPGVAQAVQRSLSPRPDTRFSTIRDMRKALGRASAAEAAAAAEALPPRRVPVAPLVGGLIGLAVLAALGLMFNRTTGLSAAPDTPASTQVSAVTAAMLASFTAPATAAASERPAPPATDAQSTPSPPTRPPSATAQPLATGTPASTATAPSAGTPLAGATIIARIDGMTLIFVPAGSFRMGSMDKDPLAFGNEKPQHIVFVDSFWIDQTEVSNRQYAECVAAGGCTDPSGFDSASRPDYYHDPQFSDYPVIWVNWRQARAYCVWTGRRLPTEAEWEKAARGDGGRIYPWGDQPPDNTLLNFNRAARDTAAVGSFPNGASPYGVLDMAGNVVEWVDGYYYDSYFTVVNNTITPTPSFHGGVRALRSSAWDDLLASIRIAARRFSESETSAYGDVGFRCAVTERP